MKPKRRVFELVFGLLTTGLTIYPPVLWRGVNRNFTEYDSSGRELLFGPSTRKVWGSIGEMSLSRHVNVRQLLFEYFVAFGVAVLLQALVNWRLEKRHEW